MDGNADDFGTKQTWNERYGERHRWRRYRNWPPGLTAPVKVRLYERNKILLLSWWDPGARKNLSERIDGDLLTALARARVIDDRVRNFRTAGRATPSKLGHEELVSRYLADLTQRVEARLLEESTLDRYRAALAHYAEWCKSPVVLKKYSSAASVDREFRLELTAFLMNRPVSGNGRKGVLKPMKSPTFVLDVVRSMYVWAADPVRGNLMPEGFSNPFLRGGEHRPLFVGDPLAPPRITMAMAAAFLTACSTVEKKLFAPIILFGLRAAEPCFIAGEHISEEWFEVPNLPELDYRTKGRRDKRFPWARELQGLRDLLCADGRRGLLYRRRDYFERGEAGAEFSDLEKLTREYRNRLAAANPRSHIERRNIRKGLLREAGALAYDDIERLFHRIVAKLGWTGPVTLKDFRHLFATTLNDANVSESYRKYLLGHAPGRAAAVAYTHLSRLREQFATVLRSEFAAVLQALSE
jgi:hypothetical protein